MKHFQFVVEPPSPVPRAPKHRLLLAGKRIEGAVRTESASAGLLGMPAQRCRSSNGIFSSLFSSLHSARTGILRARDQVIQDRLLLCLVQDLRDTVA